MNDTTLIFDATLDSFSAVVLDNSQHTLVIADFWASWCAPCRTLMPLLEKLTGEYAGKIILARINADEQTELAAQWNVRSLPTVKLFKKGVVVDEFIGARPAAQIKALLDKHVVRESEKLRTAAKFALTKGDLTEAHALLEKARAIDPDHLPVIIDSVTVMIKRGDIEGAEQLVNSLPLSQQDSEEVTSLRSLAMFAAAARTAPAAEALMKRLGAESDDLEARYQLGARNVVDGNYPEGLEQFLAIMRRDRQYQDDIGRRALVACFALLGHDHDLSQEYRRKMARLLH